MFRTQALKRIGEGKKEQRRKQSAAKGTTSNLPDRIEEESSERSQKEEEDQMDQDTFVGQDSVETGSGEGANKSLGEGDEYSREDSFFSDDSQTTSVSARGRAKRNRRSDAEAKSKKRQATESDGDDSNDQSSKKVKTRANSPKPKKSKTPDADPPSSSSSSLTKADIPAFIQFCNANVGSHGCVPHKELKRRYPDHFSGKGEILAKSVLGRTDRSKILGWKEGAVKKLFSKVDKRNNAIPGLNSNGEIAKKGGKAQNRAHGANGHFISGETEESDTDEDVEKKGKMNGPERSRWMEKLRKAQADQAAVTEQARKEVAAATNAKRTAEQNAKAKDKTLIHVAQALGKLVTSDLLSNDAKETVKQLKTTCLNGLDAEDKKKGESLFVKTEPEN